MQDPKIQRLLDHSAIVEVIHSYCRGVDRRDYDLVRRTYHADAYDDHGDYKGGVDGLIAWVRARHADIPHSMHFVLNCLIEFLAGDHAVAETYFIRKQVGPGAKNSGTVVISETMGRYVDQFERRDDQWRVARRVVVFEAVVNTVATSAPLGHKWIWQRRNTTDPVYFARFEMLERLALCASRAEPTLPRL